MGRRLQLETCKELCAFSTAPVDASWFEAPAGFKKPHRFTTSWKQSPGQFLFGYSA